MKSSRIVEMLEHASETAILALQVICDNGEKESDKVSAAKAILANRVAMGKYLDLEKRVESIESGIETEEAGSEGVTPYCD